MVAHEGFRAASERAGIDCSRVDDYRDTLSCLWKMQGFPLGVVRDPLGHSAVSVTER